MSAFQTLSKIDVSEHTEKKGKFTYLSWAWAFNESIIRKLSSSYLGSTYLF